MTRAFIIGMLVAFLLIVAATVLLHASPFKLTRPGKECRMEITR